MTHTTPDMADRHERLIMGLSEEERFRMDLQMADDGWRIRLGGIRARHPETAGDEPAFRRAVGQHRPAEGWVRLEAV